MLLREVAERRQQFLVAGRIGRPEVIDRLDEAEPEKIGPHSIDDRPGEVGVSGRRQPTGERQAAVTGVVYRERVAIERGGELRLARFGLEEITARLDEQRPHAVTITGLTPPALCPDPGEEVGERVVLVVGPFFERMVVALGAIDRQRQERLGHVLGHRLRILMDGEEVGGAVLHARPPGRDDPPNDFIPGHVLGNAIADPAVVGIDGLRPQLGP